MFPRSFKEKFPQVKSLTLRGKLVSKTRSAYYEDEVTFSEENILSWLHCPSCGSKIYITSYLGWNVIMKRLNYDEGVIKCSGYIIYGNQRQKCGTELRYKVIIEYIQNEGLKNR